MSSTGRVYGLDILRAYAILTVVTAHAQDLLLEKNILRLAIDFFSVDGVSVFFVLSGFLIGGILIKRIQKNKFDSNELFNFWIRRWFRTLPAYFLILTFYIVVALCKENSPSSIPWFSFITFTQNFASPPPPHFFEEAWSLSVEEWFYLMIPFSLYLSLRFTEFENCKIIVFWISLIILLVTILRIYRAYEFNYFAVEQWDIYLRKQVVTRLDSLMYGFLGAYIYYYAKVKTSIVGKFILLMLGFFILFVPNVNYYLLNESLWSHLIYRNYFQLTTVCLGTLLLFPFLLTIKTGKGVLYKSITFISLISYSLYLIHSGLVKGIIMRALDENLGLSAIVHYTLYYVISIILASILYNYYEKPIMNVRDIIGQRKLFN